jgi:uncharacterized protein YxjI
MDDRFGADHYEVEQLIRPMVNLYRISSVAPDGDTKPVAFVRQKRLAMKEDIRFFAEEDESEELFRIKARRVIEIGGRYDVTDPQGERIGVLEKRFAKSLIRSTWRLLGPQEEVVGEAQERNVAVAILRRVQDTIPLPYHFTISVDGREVGGVARRFTLRDRYTLDLSGDVDRRIDRRLAVAFAVGVDTLQDR